VIIKLTVDFVAPEVIVGGVKVASLGRPVTPNTTGLAKPFAVGVMVIQDGGGCSCYYYDGRGRASERVAIHGEGDGSWGWAATRRGVDHGYADGAGGGDIAAWNRGGNLSGADERRGLGFGAEVHRGGCDEVCAVDRESEGWQYSS
jgi:hypothetical protein